MRRTIIAQAGRLGAVTVATNMAGRGTDILLGGNPEFIADETLRARGLSPAETPEEYEAAWDDALEAAKAQVKAEHEQVVEAGGLYVLGTERHESRRIDNQLRGRSGRQGDPGESRFYLSLGDDLMRRFNGPMLESMMTTLRVPDDQPIESKMVSRAIRSAQTQVEQQNFEVRKDVLKYDEVLNRQRTVIYDERRKVLEGADLHVQIQSMVDDVIGAYVDGATETGYAEDWDLERCGPASRRSTRWAWTATSCSTASPTATSRRCRAETLKQELLDDVHRAYDEREAALGSEVMRELERRVLLVGARPQVARAPLRDGLPAGRHPPARDGQPRPGRGVPARGLRHVQRDARRHQGGVRRLPVQPRGEDQGGAGGRGQGQAGRGRGRRAGRRAGGDGAGAGPPGGGGRRPRRPTAAAPKARRARRRARKARPKAAGRCRRAGRSRRRSRRAPGRSSRSRASTRRGRRRTCSYSAPTLDASPKDGGAAKAAKTATVTGTKETAAQRALPLRLGQEVQVAATGPPAAERS